MLMDTNQFKAMILPLTGKLYRFACHMLRESVEAEDAVQEVCMKLWKIRDSLDKLNRIEAFAMKVTKNYCLDRLKARKPVYIGNYSAWYENSHEATDPHHLLERAERTSLLYRILEKLPDQQRVIIYLRELESMDFEAIAEITGMNVNAIRVCLFRARNKIKEELLKFEQNGTRSNRTSADKVL
jgi:RNA polymerase sigma-70 factor (ECF subfamily)